jgi:hypothetical protein
MTVQILALLVAAAVLGFAIISALPVSHKTKPYVLLAVK